jgi:putative ABC transport system substrate-binding protein
LLSGGTLEDDAFRVNGVRQGLAENGIVEGRDVAFEYRGAGGRYDQLPALAADLVRSKVAVIASLGPTLSALAAKAASTTVPVVFYMGADPVKIGLVASLNRPDGNVTGVSLLFNIVVAKQFELLREAVPGATSIGFLVNPANSNAKPDASDAQVAAQALGQKLIIVQARTESEFQAAFETLAEQRIGALLLMADVFFHGQLDQLAALALRHRLPMLSSWREGTAAGGLMSYGANSADGYRQQGLYVGRILKGEKPVDLPVVLPTKFQFVLNLRTAKALGLMVPLSVQVAADEVIE